MSMTCRIIWQNLLFFCLKIPNLGSLDPRGQCLCECWETGPIGSLRKCVDLIANLGISWRVLGVDYPALV